MIRASRLHREGRGFESLNIHHKKQNRPHGRFYFCVWGCGTKTPVGVFDNESASILIKCECSTRSVRERMPRSRRLCAVRGSPGHPPQNFVSERSELKKFLCHTKPCAKCGFLFKYTYVCGTKNKTPNCLSVLLLEAWVGIEPAYKDLQSSA